MNELNITLSPTDRVVLESYKVFAEGLCDYLGSGYEIVLHSLENMNKSVIKILNGFHTGRSEGAPITDLALEMLSHIKKTKDVPYISYSTRNKKGEPLRSTTIIIKGENERIIGLMCINFYLNSPYLDIISPLLANRTAFSSLNETFADSPEDIIEKAVTTTKQRVYSDDSITAGIKNREIIADLYKKGIFSLKNSVVRTAELLEISKNTVYMHLRYLNGSDD